MRQRGNPFQNILATSSAKPKRQRWIQYMLAVTLVIGTIVACRPTSTPTPEIMPPYLRLQLCEGTAQWQSATAATPSLISGDIMVEESGQLITAAAGARFCFEDGSTLSLDPQTEVTLKNPHIVPHLQILLDQGRAMFEAQGLSYEFLMPVCSLQLVDAPTQVEIFNEQETMHLKVHEGALSCTLANAPLNVFSCWELTSQSGEEPTLIEFCSASATATAVALTPSPTPTPPGFKPSPTPVPITPTPTSTPTPTRRPVTPRPTATPTPLIVPTDTPPSAQNPTESPPTAPPPTTPPPTTPPPTTEIPTERPTPGGI